MLDGLAEGKPGRTRRTAMPVRLGALLVVLALAAAILVARSESSLSSGLSGTGGARFGGSISVTPGEAGDFSSFLVNHTAQTVVLRTARLLYAPGYLTPSLAGVAVEPGKGLVGAGRGWPYRGGGHIQIARFAGYRLLPGHTAQILIGIKGRKPGLTYAADGVAVTVSAGGQTATVDSLGPGAICVAARDHRPCSVVANMTS